MFERYIGIDYSGASFPDKGLSGLRAFICGVDEPAHEVRPKPEAKYHWSRRHLADWLETCLAEPIVTLIGIDHGFSFPAAYFDRHALPEDWDAFLDDFSAYWPTQRSGSSVRDFWQKGDGHAGQRRGETRWRRLVEERCGGKSVFHFGVQGEVASSTHAGLPFLGQLRRDRPDVHFWPFDGWMPLEGCSVVVEAYPRLYSGDYVRAPEHSADQHDAFSIASWLRDRDRDGTLRGLFDPDLSDKSRQIASYEGWILGVQKD